MNQQIEKINVTEKLQIIKDCEDIVTKLVQNRKELGLTQEFIAEWLGVSRKKINEFESGKFDFELMVYYADKFSIDLELKLIEY